MLVIEEIRGFVHLDKLEIETEIPIHSRKATDGARPTIGLSSGRIKSAAGHFHRRSAPPPSSLSTLML